jgi:hypothetical protein
LPGAYRSEELEVTDGVSNVRFLGNCILKEKGYLGRLCEFFSCRMNLRHLFWEGNFILWEISEWTGSSSWWTHI